MHTHVHAILMAILLLTLGQPFAPIIFRLHLFLTSSPRFHLFYQVFLRRPLLCSSIIMQCLTQSAFTSPNHLNLSVLITELTDYNPNSSLSSAFFFLSLNVNTYAHLNSL